MTVPKTFNLKKRSLSFGLAVSLILIIIIVESGILGYIYSRQSQILLHELNKKADDHAANIGEVLAIPLWDFDDEQIKNIGSGYINKDIIAEIHIRDQQGKTLYKSAATDDDSERIARSVDIIYKDQLIGSARLSISLKPYQMELLWLRNAILTALFASVVVILIGTGFLLRIFLRKPLHILLTGIDRVAKGDYEYGFDEIQYHELAGIVRRFSDMAVKIQSREKSLRRVNRELKHEIADRKSAEERITQSESKYRSILENMKEGYFEVDLKGVFTFINNTMVDMSGYSEAELLGMNFRDIVDEKTAQRIFTIFNRIYNTRQSEKIISFDTIRKKGDRRNVEISVSFTRDIKNNPTGFSGVVRDITERIVAEEDKKQLESQLLHAQKMESIGTLAGGIAHDFNNILSSIIGYTELILNDVEKGSQLENNLHEVHTAGMRARDLVKQILAFARRAEVELKPIKVSVIVKDVLKLLRSTIPASIEIRKKFDSDSLVMGDASQVHQIFMNLCTNAVHAMEERGGVLAVSISDTHIEAKNPMGLKPDDYLQIAIADTGPGVVTDAIDHIFEPYFTTKKSGEGTGMGLATVHGIVKGYGGDVTVESETGSGAVFTVFLPLTKKRESGTVYTPDAVSSGNEHILLVDDEPPIVEVNRLALERLGYSVTVLTNSLEALALFKQKPNQFDLVITDMNMPNLAGDDLAGEIKKIQPHIPIILCTGFSKRITSENAVEKGISGILMKPVALLDLANNVRKVLDEANTLKHENVPAQE
jgi:PAS domain S-box-containing protein